MLFIVSNISKIGFTPKAKATIIAICSPDKPMDPKILSRFYGGSELVFPWEFTVLRADRDVEFGDIPSGLAKLEKVLTDLSEIEIIN